MKYLASDQYVIVVLYNIIITASYAFHSQCIARQSGVERRGVTTGTCPLGTVWFIVSMLTPGLSALPVNALSSVFINSKFNTTEVYEY